jgi:hypothetical protein
MSSGSRTEYTAHVCKLGILPIKATRIIYLHASTAIMVSWLPLLGLILGAIGSALVILPTFPAIRPHLVDQDEINRLEEGRQKLSKGNLVSVADSSFEPILEIVKERWTQEFTDEPYGFYRPEIEYSTGEHSYTDNSLIVYSIDQGCEDMEYPDLLQDIQSIFVVDMWINDKTRELRTNPIQRVRGIGFFSIVLSVFIQVGLSFS